MSYLKYYWLSLLELLEQVLALTSHVEAGFERKEKTCMVLIDLSAAYDTVWTDGLKMKLARTIRCRKTLKLLDQMIGPRKFHVVLDGTTSKTKRIKEWSATRISSGSCTFQYLY